MSLTVPVHSNLQTFLESTMSTCTTNTFKQIFQISATIKECLKQHYIIIYIKATSIYFDERPPRSEIC